MQLNYIAMHTCVTKCVNLLLHKAVAIKYVD